MGFMKSRPFYVVMKGPYAGRVEYERVADSQIADGAWLFKEDYPELYQNLGRLFEPPKLLKVRLSPMQRLNNWLFKKTNWPFFLLRWKSPIVANPDYHHEVFQLPDWRKVDMVTIVLRQGLNKLAVNDPRPEEAIT